MKAKNNSQGISLTEPLLEHIKQRDQANFEANFPKPAVDTKALAQPDLYQDSGGGYRANFTYPQD